ncbi:hypothetical protein [Streptomyces fulvorobeus]|uniref:Uncharacterized protein n=1 Tax=Streptomyces fulvorobeus TaxID=284028 RepID=A0A7J0CBR8_9ACTN|nr:hypothetical protein [Streptomyces fulvorobeus]NYE43455.1 hypothetical protein [Streptomyces fulvorobeus]GFM99922.1 hypothetical protein Sfulv_47330 [Streptomyces fulvorobeus]
MSSGQLERSNFTQGGFKSIDGGLGLLDAAGGDGRSGIDIALPSRSASGFRTARPSASTLEKYELPSIRTQAVFAVLALESEPVDPRLWERGGDSPGERRSAW